MLKNDVNKLHKQWHLNGDPLFLHIGLMSTCLYLIDVSSYYNNDIWYTEFDVWVFYSVF